MRSTRLRTIAVLNDASEVEHHPVKKPTRYQKLHFHISKHREARF